MLYKRNNYLKDLQKVLPFSPFVPDAPDIRVELADDEIRKYPFKPWGIKTGLNEDRSVMDQ